ncbi:MAG: hypothetical protein ACLGHK_00430, partial [Alphaproteobacteria bacterium]
MKHKGFRLAAAAMVSLLALATSPVAAETFKVTVPATAKDGPFDGRVMLMLTPDGKSEPRYQTRPDYFGAQMFGVNVDGLKPGASATIGA